MKKGNKYKKLIRLARGKIKSARIPRTLSRRNNNVFSNEKHIIMLTLMKKERKHYDEMPDFLDLLKEEIGLPRVPHFTTINKFALRAKPWWFTALMEEIVKAMECGEVVAVDGTGFSLDKRSGYFQTISGKRKKFMHFHACYEQKNKLIVSCRVHRKARSETLDFPLLARDACRQLKITHFLADKAYDCERHYKFAKYDLGAVLVAPLRRHGKKVKGFYRKQMIDLPSIYNLRSSICETGHSGLKGMYGEHLISRKFVAQKNELLCQAWVYNLMKLVNLSRIEVYFL